MYSKCQLFYLDKIKPESVSDAAMLLATLELAVRFYFNKLSINRAYNINGIYCNRRLIDYQTDTCEPGNKYISSPEINNLTNTIMQLVSDVLDVFYIYKKTNPNGQLNVELSLLSRHNLAISYEIF